jgi:hypothetical protein
MRKREQELQAIKVREAQVLQYRRKKTERPKSGASALEVLEDRLNEANPASPEIPASTPDSEAAFVLRAGFGPILDYSIWHEACELVL